jgi:hypothetical protein
MLTVDTLRDFQFGERAPGDLYSGAAQMDGSSSSGGEARVSGRLSPPPDLVTDLLTDSLKDVQGDPGAVGLLFLVRKDRVTDDLESQYRERGLAVPMRVIDLRGTTLKKVYDVLPRNVVLDEVDPQNATPAIPSPGTVLLLLAACVPLAAVWPRR